MMAGEELWNLASQSERLFETRACETCLCFVHTPAYISLLSVMLRRMGHAQEKTRLDTLSDVFQRFDVRD